MPDPAVLRVRPGERLHDELLATLSAEPLATQWWRDAESRATPAASYMVVYMGEVPAAWAGWFVEDHDGRRVLRCCDNYVRRGYRRRSPELYTLAYRRRHRDVVRRLGLPAVTYLYPEPIGLHLRNGWVYDTSPGSAGVSTPYPDQPAGPDNPEHRWRRLRWAPPALSVPGSTQ